MYSIVFQHLQLAELSDSQEHLLSVFPKCIRCLLTGLMSWMWPFSTRKPGYSQQSKYLKSTPRGEARLKRNQNPAFEMPKLQCLIMS